jgi:hypothetical protein
MYFDELKQNEIDLKMKHSFCTYEMQKLKERMIGILKNEFNLKMAYQNHKKQ